LTAIPNVSKQLQVVIAELSKDPNRGGQKLWVYAK